MSADNTFQNDPDGVDGQNDPDGVDGIDLIRADDRVGPSHALHHEEKPIEMRADDALKYALEMFAERTEWAQTAISTIAGDDPDIAFLDAALCEIENLALRFGDPARYSDGRRVKSRADIAQGIYYEHIWHPEMSQETPQNWRGKLLSDPGNPCPGYFVVTTDPVAQQIDVRVVRA